MLSPLSPSVLKWDDEFNLVETNAENKALIETLYEKEKHLMQLENKCESNKEEIQVMSDLFQNFKRELKNTGVICCAKERERELERHLKTLEESETSRLVQDSKRMREERRSVGERKNTFENHKFKAEQQLEAFKNQMTWNQLTMDAFLEESAQIDEETMAIIKYAQQEEQRIKSLTFNIEKTTQEANENHRALDKEMTETLSTQIALDKTMDSLQQVHQDRRQLIHLWENTINQRKCRDAEMQHCAMTLARFNQDFREKNDTLKGRKHLLETRKKENKEPEKEIFFAKQQAVQLQADLREQESNCSGLQDELYCGKGALNKATTDLAYARSHISSMKKDVQDNEDKLMKSGAKNVALEEELRVATETSLNEEQRARKMQKLVKDQEQDIKKLDSQLRGQRVEMFHQKQCRQDLREKEEASLTLISRSRCHISSQGSQLHKMDRERHKEEKIMKQLESIIAQQNEQQVLLPDGFRTEEKEMIEQKIAELTNALKEKKRMDNMLTNLLRECEGGTRHLRKETARSEAQNRDLTAKVEHLQVLSEANDKELKNVQFQKQDAMVEYNIMKFEIKRFRDLLYNKADNVLTLESRKLKLQRDIAEREEKDKACRETLSKHIKISEEERKKLSVELNEKLAKVDVTKSRFETLAISMAAPEGKEERSQIYYIIKAVQEKEEIKRMGDSLDAKIHEVELQNKVMESSVLLFSHSNTAFRNTINNVTKSSAEHQEKLRLEEQLRTAEETHMYKTGQVQVLQQDLQDLSDTMEDIMQDENPEKEKEGRKLSLIRKLNKEMDSKREKTVRAKTQCTKITRAIRSAKETKRETPEEKMMKLRQWRGSDKTFNNMLGEIMRVHSGLRPVLEEHFLQANLPLPPRCLTPGSRRGSLTNSACVALSIQFDQRH